LPRLRLVAVALLAACLPRRRFCCGLEAARRGGEPELSSVPAQLAGWTTTSLSSTASSSLGRLLEWVHPGTSAARMRWRSFSAPPPPRRAHRLPLAEARHPGSGWEVIARGEAKLLSGRTVRRLEVRAPGEDRQVSYLWTEGVEDPATEVLRATLALDAVHGGERDAPGSRDSPPGSRPRPSNPTRGCAPSRPYSNPSWSGSSQRIDTDRLAGTETDAAESCATDRISEFSLSRFGMAHRR